MAQSVVESLFRDDPFFERAHMLWPSRGLTLSSFREDFLQRRSHLLQSLRSELRNSLLGELRDGLHSDLFRGLDKWRTISPTRLMDSTAEKNPRPDLKLTLDTQGFSPEDVTVTLSGRRLEVLAAKKPEAHAPPDASESKSAGFVQAVDLPDHVDPATLSCSLGEDGLLCVTAAQIKQSSSEERVVPIRFRTTLDFPISSNTDTNKMESSSDL